MSANVGVVVGNVSPSSSAAAERRPTRAVLAQILIRIRLVFRLHPLCLCRSLSIRARLLFQRGCLSRRRAARIGLGLGLGLELGLGLGLSRLGLVGLGLNLGLGGYADELIIDLVVGAHVVQHRRLLEVSVENMKRRQT